MEKVRCRKALEGYMCKDAREGVVKGWALSHESEVGNDLEEWQCE